MKNIKSFDEFLQDDELTEKKKIDGDEKNPLDKKTGKKSKDDDDEDDEPKKGKKGDDEDDDEEDDDKKSGLTAKQKKLPKGLQDAILKRQKK
jgi:hypothetical protein